MNQTRVGLADRDDVHAFVCQQPQTFSAQRNMLVQAMHGISICCGWIIEREPGKTNIGNDKQKGRVGASTTTNALYELLVAPPQSKISYIYGKYAGALVQE